MFFAAAASACLGLFGFTPQPRAVAGMIWAMPVAPAGLRALALKPDSWLIWRVKTPGSRPYLRAFLRARLMRAALLAIRGTGGSRRSRRSHRRGCRSAG